MKKLNCIALVGLITVPGVYLLSLQALAEESMDIEEHLANLQIVEQTFLLPLAAPPLPEVERTINVIVTAYSSTECQTDDTPFITASGEPVGQGIVANNLLSFGTQIRLPELFGIKTFVVKDRMNRRKGDFHVDIWFPTREQALEFGAKTTVMQVLN